MTLQIRDSALKPEAGTTEGPVRFDDWINYKGLTPDERQRVVQHVMRHTQAPHNLGVAGPRTLHAAADGEPAIIRAIVKAVIAATVIPFLHQSELTI